MKLRRLRLELGTNLLPLLLAVTPRRGVSRDDKNGDVDGAVGPVSSQFLS